MQVFSHRWVVCVMLGEVLQHVRFETERSLMYKNRAEMKQWCSEPRHLVFEYEGLLLVQISEHLIPRLNLKSLAVDCERFHCSSRARNGTFCRDKREQPGTLSSLSRHGSYDVNFRSQCRRHADV